jgi:glycerophosphoryl diester phosphodiesterase
MISYSSTLPLLIGHRGILESAPENSIIGAIIAKQMGINCIEVDAMLCKDKNVVIHHDFDLQRSTGIYGMVKDFNYSELQKLNIINKFESIDVIKIPKMEDMILQCDKINLILNIEIKCEENDFLVGNTVCKKIREYGNPKRIVISSFNVHILNLAKKIIPCYERNYIVNKIPDDWLKTMYEFDCTSIIVSREHNSFEEIKDLTKYGIPVFVFTINDINTYRRFNSIGVGVFSDRPYTLKKYF